MKIMRVDATPNPNAFKFLLDGEIVSTGSRHYDAAPSRSEDPLAAEIFALPGVASVFFMENFISITSDGRILDWSGVEKKLGELVSGISPAVSAATGGTPNATAASASAVASSNELLEKINGLLDEYVRPALASDGGGLEVIGLDGDDLVIRYQGACGTCPSSIGGTLFAIQNLVRQELKVNINVIPG